jgi:hypothetical protein
VSADGTRGPGDTPGPDYTDPTVPGAARDAERPRRRGEEDGEADPRDTGLRTGDVKEGNTLVDPGPGD